MHDSTVAVNAGDDSGDENDDLFVAEDADDIAGIAEEDEGDRNLLSLWEIDADVVVESASLNPLFAQPQRPQTRELLL
ncbi:hypothetical protein PI125_g10834 [Phytophthora idaei]|nr:hypothetical protein PI125_g10834 [Phytophthora idaei]